MNRTRVKQLLRSGRVRVNGTPATRHDHPLRPGDRVSVARDAPAGPAGMAVVYEDDALVAIDKPAGLLAVATASEKTDTAFARLRAHLAARRAGRPFVVHRLDRETSGLLLFARGPLQGGGVETAAKGLLAHLSLMFVPAGVGVTALASPKLQVEIEAIAIVAR